MAIIDINWRNFTAGESTNAWTADRGFSPDSFGLNLTKERGVLHFIEAATDVSDATIADTIIATTPDPLLAGRDLYMVGDEGNYYYQSGTTITLGDTGGGYSYTLGTVDVLGFQGSFFATTQTTVALFEDDVTNLVEDWWSGLSSGVRHPLEVVEGEMFIGDGNIIQYWDGTASGVAFTLPTGQNTTTLRRHPDGQTLLAFTGDTGDFSHTRGGGAKVYYCDPVLRDWTREVVIEAQVEGSRNVGGTIYTTWGRNVGFFDGNGLEWLKELQTSTTTYSHSMGAFEDDLLVRDGRVVKRFGDLGQGRVWWNMYKNQTNSNNIAAIAYQGDNRLMSFFDDGSGDGKAMQVDYDNSGPGGEFKSNRISFPEEVEVDRIELIHDTTDSVGSTIFTVNSIDVADTESAMKVVTHTNESTNRTTVGADVKTDIFQLGLLPANDDIGYKLMRIHYDGIDA